MALDNDEVGSDCNSVVNRVDVDALVDPRTEEIESCTRDVSVFASFSMSISIIISVAIIHPPSAGTPFRSDRVVALFFSESSW